jgi:hypothetical protein
MDLVPKQGALILVGGGSGRPTPAINHANFMFKKLNASFNEDDYYAYSLMSDNVPPWEDEVVIQKVKSIAKNLNSRKIS